MGALKDTDAILALKNTDEISGPGHGTLAKLASSITEAQTGLGLRLKQNRVQDRALS